MMEYINSNILINVPGKAELDFPVKSFKFHKAVKDLEEQVILKVLEQLLSRPITVDDFKNVQRIYPNQFIDNEYILAYNYNELGKIKFNHSTDIHDYTLTIDFIAKN